MRFAVALPWWGYVLAFGLAIVLAWAAYARVIVPLTRGQRTLLTLLRASALIVIVTALLRPVAIVPRSEPDERLLAVLIDNSRSMRLADGGEPRMDQARSIARELADGVGPGFKIEWLTVGESLVPAELDTVEPTGRQSDLTGGLEALGERYRQQRLAGVVVISDGGDTSSRVADTGRLPAAPVFTVGIGSADAPRDREVVNLTAGEPLLPEASIDLSVSAVSHGFGTTPIELRVSANGRPVDVRRVTPASDGAPVHQVFTVSPSPETPTVYTVEVPAVEGETSSENNARSVLVPPQQARRRVLVVEGAPGFEHTFLKRALAGDRGLDVDSVVRKGQNDNGRPTFFVQASGDRAAALATGYPQTREALFKYDAIVFGNVEADFFTREQLSLTAAFVAERGGGLLVLGARSFERQGLSTTPLEEVLPVDLADRRADVARTSGGSEGQALNVPGLTPDGTAHAATRLAAAPDANRKAWESLPPLASISLVGGARPGAQVLAVAGGATGGLPLIAVQRYGQGRAMVFAGEASWRWRMMRPASDTTYDTIWRQLVRWTAAASPGTVAIAPMAVTLPGGTYPVSVQVRDPEFRPVADAEVAMTVTGPDGTETAMNPTLADAADGRYLAPAHFDQPGVYRVTAEARRGQVSLGTATRVVLAGGTDIEMADPRLNEPMLQRLAGLTGGRYLRADEADELPGLLRDAQPEEAATELRDLWHNAWTLLAILGLLAAEWLVRRRVGLT
jgi:uncharacterized membrane protein